MLDQALQTSELSLEDFLTFRDFIHEKSGIFFSENKKYLLENRLSKRMVTLGLKTHRDYFYQVKYDTSMKEFNMLMNLVTTNETSFFRNPPQLTCFQEEVLPLVLDKAKRSGRKRLRIWSAGCSTGEEPYTIAMILLEAMGDLSGWNIEIIANDISEQVLHAARTGVYGELSLRTTPPEIVRKYFQQDGANFAVKDAVKRMVTFGHLNLTDQRRMALMTDMDFIFCRNVTIYFSDDVKRQIVRDFYNSLVPGGYLFIGHAESLHGISKAFKLLYFKNGLVYHKEPAARLSDHETPAAVPVATAAKAAAAPTTASAATAARSQASSETHAATMEKLRKIQELLSNNRKKTS